MCAAHAAGTDTFFYPFRLLTVSDQKADDNARSVSSSTGLLAKSFS
jgi:hypothetical protein